MKVKLIACTKPVDDLQCSPDEFIAYIARVSNPGNQNNHLTADKLLRYLVKHKHWSPFEHCYVTFSIETTRDIGRQILRHRSFTFQEFSQRYADPTKDMWFENREARLQDLKNRQNSVATDDKRLHSLWEGRQDLVIMQAQEAYEWAIENGIAKEQARAVLPEGLTGSRMYMTGSLRSFIHFIQVRHHPAAQKEIREIAADIMEHIIKQFPTLEEFLQKTIEENYSEES